jgi:hypothetical protein
MYIYFHDVANLAVYRAQSQADVVERSDGSSGAVLVYVVSTPVQITRADNILLNGFWIHPVTDHWSQSFENIGGRYNRERVVAHFLNNKFSGYSEIARDEYEELKLQYEKKARSNVKAAQ